MLLQIMASYTAILSFSVVQRVPVKYLFFSALSGSVAWISYLMINNAGHSVMAAAFLSTLILAVFSHVLARIIKAPVTVFLIPGLLPVVPGGSIYRCVYYIIGNNSELSVYYLMETLQIAGAMALAVFIADSVFPSVLRKASCGRSKEKV